MKSLNILTILSLVFTLLLIAPVYSQDTSQDLILTLEIDKESFKIDESIWVTSKIINISDHTIALPKYILWNELILKRGNATPEILTADGPIITRKEDFIILKPGEFHKRKFDLTKIESFKLNAETWNFQTIEAYGVPSGSYTSLHPQEWTGTLKSNTIRFIIQNEKE